MSGYNAARGAHPLYQSPKDVSGSPYTPITNTTPTGYQPTGPANGMGGFMHHDSTYASLHTHHPHHSPSGPQRPTIQTNGGPYGVQSPVSTQHSGYHSQPINTPQSASATPYVPQSNFPPFTLPPSEYTATSATGMSGESGQAYAPPTSAEYGEHSQPHASGEMMLLDQMAAQTTIPVFGTDGVLNKSPYISIPEDFVAYLFNSNSSDGSPTMGPIVPPNQYSKYVKSPHVYVKQPLTGTSVMGTTNSNMACHTITQRGPPSAISRHLINHNRSCRLLISLTRTSPSPSLPRRRARRYST